jgi:spore coat-associated protein N
VKTYKKVLLSVGAVAAVASAGSAGSFALFTADKDSAANQVSAGRLTMDIGSAETDGVLGLADMAIGDSTSGTLTVKNTGTIGGIYAVTGKPGTGGIDGTLAQSAIVRIWKDAAGTGAPAVEQSLAAFNAGSGVGGLTLAKSDGAAGGTDETTLKFEVSLPSSSTGTDNDLQGLAGNEVFHVHADQRAGQARPNGSAGL